MNNKIRANVSLALLAAVLLVSIFTDSTLGHVVGAVLIAAYVFIRLGRSKEEPE